MTLGGPAAGASELTERLTGLSVGLLNSSPRLAGVQIGLRNHAGNNPRLLRWLPVISLHLR